MCVYIHTLPYIYKGAAVPLWQGGFLNSWEGPQAVWTWLHRPRVNLWAFCLFELGRNHKRIPLRLGQIPLKAKSQHGSFPHAPFSPAWEEHSLHLATARGPRTSPKILPLDPFPHGWVAPTQSLEFGRNQGISTEKLWKLLRGVCCPFLWGCHVAAVRQNCLKWSNSKNCLSFKEKTLHWCLFCRPCFVTSLPLNYSAQGFAPCSTRSRSLRSLNQPFTNGIFFHFLLGGSIHWKIGQEQ